MVRNPKPENTVVVPVVVHTKKEKHPNPWKNPNTVVVPVVVHTKKEKLPKPKNTVVVPNVVVK